MDEIGSGPHPSFRTALIHLALRMFMNDQNSLLDLILFKAFYLFMLGVAFNESNRVRALQIPSTMLQDTYNSSPQML